MVNPKSLENLKTPPPGQSANPSGVSNKPRRIPVQNSLNRVLAKIEVSKDFRGKAPVIDSMLLTWCRTWVKLCNKAKSAEELGKLTDSMIKMQAIADDKEIANTVELTGPSDPAAQTKATKTSTVVLQGGEIVKQEETRTVTQTVELTGGNDGERTDHGPKRSKS